MRTMRMCLLGAAAAALLVVAMPVAGASASPKLLVMSESGKALSAGAPTKIGVLIGQCTVWSEGKLKTNEATKDAISGTPESTECTEGSGVTASGGITEAQYGSNGKFTLKGKITLVEPGPCAYTFSKWKGVFAIPGVVFVEELTAEGKLFKKLSEKSGCAPTSKKEYGAGVTSPGGELLEEALKS